MIDKDLAAALLAERLDASALLMLTDVPNVVAGWGEPGATILCTVTTATLREIPFSSGSMGPKVEAACRFAEATGGIAAIGALEDAAAIPAAGRAPASRPPPPPRRWDAAGSSGGSAWPPAVLTWASARPCRRRWARARGIQRSQAD